MGALDDSIAWLKARRAETVEELNDYEAGSRQYRNDVDITDKLKQRGESDIKQFDALIAAYKPLNAARR